MYLFYSSRASQGKTRCTVKLEGEVVATELARSRKTAKNKAAKVALQILTTKAN